MIGEPVRPAPDPYRPPATSADVAAARSERRHDSLVVRLGIALLALVATGAVFTSDPERPSFDLGRAVAIGVAVASIGMLVPWWRIPSFARATSWPGRNLGFLSRLLGWGGACAIPALLVAGNWPVAAGCALLPVATLGLWMRKRWAIWPWYAVGLGFVALAVWSAMVGVTDGGAAVQDAAYRSGRMGGAVLRTVVIALLGVFLLREVRAFQRSTQR
ncbi:MAG: hypothetical protein R3F34_17420 [Planctomycetota bacterium]